MSRSRHGHDFQLLGGGGGAEVWECRRCGRSTIPSPFGFLWPEALGTLFSRWRCSGERPKPRPQPTMRHEPLTEGSWKEVAVGVGGTILFVVLVLLLFG